MPVLDLPNLINWIVAGLIGFVFGAVSALLTYRLERRRDDLKWQRELEKLRLEFALQSLQRRKEYEQEKIEESSERIKAELTQGLDDPEKALRAVGALHAIVGDRFKGVTVSLDPLNSILDSIRSRRRRLVSIALCAGLVLGVFVTILVYGVLAGWHVPYTS